ncbi:hypothetical protein ES704_03556 [subsurface metagenome]
MDNSNEIVDKIDLDNGWWYCAKDIGKTLNKTNVIGVRRGIVDLILAQTFGFPDPKGKNELKRKNRKIWAYIQGKEFEEYTGAEINRISEAISYLVDNNVIKRKVKGWKKQYSFNVNVSEWDKRVFKDKCQKLLPSKRKHLITENDTKDNNDNGFKPKKDKLLPLKRKHSDKLLPSKRKVTSLKTEADFPQSGSNNRCDTIKDNGLLTPNESLNKTIYKEEEKEDIYTDNLREEKEIFDYWNSLDIISHNNKTFKDFENDIKEALKNYSLEEIKNSIKNYSLILKGEEYYYGHRYTISDFLKPNNFVKFNDLERAKENYLIRKVNNNPETEAVEYERYKPESIKETEEERKARYKKGEEQAKKGRESLKNIKGYKRLS